MLTKTDLGVSEQIGSQMGQYCIMETLARDTGHEFVFFRESLDKGFGTRTLFSAFDIPNRLLDAQIIYVRPGLQRFPIASERTFSKFRPDETTALDERLLKLSDKKNFDLQGYFGLYRHWMKYETDFMRVFRFKESIRSAASRNVDQIRARCQGRELVALHVRRTDYLKSTVHVNLSFEYYEEALSRFASDRSCLVVFSDDIAWCKRQPMFSSRMTSFSEGCSNTVDMCMMSLCDHHIVANSSFSVWGAFLNPRSEKVVVCPKYFVKPGSFADWLNGQYYPSAWSALETT